MMNEPNTSSPANVDASIMFRKYQQSKGKEKDYEKIIRCGKQRHFQDFCKHLRWKALQL